MKPTFTPDDFTPQIWETIQNGNRFRFLACGKRYIHTPFTENDRGGKVCDGLTHPVCILIAAPAIIFNGFTDSDHEWLVSLPEDHGITRRHAQTALAEAWRGVEGIQSATWPTSVFKFDFKRLLTHTNSENASPQEKTALRNINAWLNWARWEKQGLTMTERAQALTAMGLSTTGHKLKKAAENAGL